MIVKVKILMIALLVFSCAKEKEYSEKIEVVKLVETTKSWNGDLLPKYADGTPKVTVLKITIPPKSKLELHKHLVINAGVLLSGELTVVDEYKNTLELKAGDALVELVNTYHYGKNEGSVPAEIIVFYAGTVDVPITVIKHEE